MRAGLIVAFVSTLVLTNACATPPARSQPAPAPITGPLPFTIQLLPDQVQYLWGKLCPEDCQRTQVLMQDIQRQVGEQSAARAKAAAPAPEKKQD